VNKIAHSSQHSTWYNVIIVVMRADEVEVDDRPQQTLSSSFKKTTSKELVIFHCKQKIPGLSFFSGPLVYY